MPELSVVIVALDNEQRTVLQVLVDGTSVARTVHTCASFPVAASDPVMRRVQAATPDVLLVDIPGDNPAAAMRAIELLHQELPDSAVFAIGNLNQPQVIVSAMRAGAARVHRAPHHHHRSAGGFCPPDHSPAPGSEGRPARQGVHHR